MFQFRKLTAVICALCLLVTVFAGCASEEADTQAAAEPAAVSSDRGSAAITANSSSGFGQDMAVTSTSNRITGRITNIGLDAQGHLQITREPAKSDPMGDPNTWTIFVYLCGSDLETDGGLASSDLQEMIDGSLGSKARYVVMTGGALEWQNEVVDNTTLGIYLVEDGGITLLESLEYNYMNDPETLLTFLNWGIENYPAEKMGLVFWDHGGGSISGVCQDEFFFEDIQDGVLEDISGYNLALSLSDISDVLSQVYERMTDQFEFVGYDACLMGTLENAFMLSSYARYMYASEELEPGYGWDYVAIGNAIGSSGKINGARLGKTVCDSFYQSCADIEREENATLSCIDLSKIDDLIMAFDAFSVNMLAASEDPASLARIVQKMGHVEFFGGNSQSEGYFNLVDLACAVKALSSVVPGADLVQLAIDQAVQYSKTGIYHKRSCGLSVYYPLHIDEGSRDLGEFAKVACSPYYYGYVAQNAYAAANGGLDGYDRSVSLNAWVSAMDADVENIIEDYGDVQITGESPYIVFLEEPQLFEDGTYGFSIAEESMPYVSRVDADIFFMSDDGEDLVYLGSTNDVLAVWEDGIFVDNFDGLWFCLPDGQLISATVVNESDTQTIYTTPVLLNGEETNLRFVVNNSDYTVILDGIWTGEESNGFGGRNICHLKEGDIIQPLFIATNVETGEESTYFGEEYAYDGSNEWFYNDMFDSEYYYQFSIYDIYGDSYITDNVSFTVENGEIYFNLEA